MKVEEAIKKLEYIRYVGNGEQKYQECSEEIAINLAIKALEKQIPKKAIEHKQKIGFPFYECPTCGEIDILWQNYCDNCGQKLDWEE